MGVLGEFAKRLQMDYSVANQKGVFQIPMANEAQGEGCNRQTLGQQIAPNPVHIKQHI